MKSLLIYFASIIIIKPSAFSQNIKSDTNFILRENGWYYHSIFIDTNKHSRFYTELEKNANSPFDSIFYFGGIDRFKKNKIKISEHTIIGIEKSWHPLYLYK